MEVSSPLMNEGIERPVRKPHTSFVKLLQLHSERIGKWCEVEPQDPHANLEDDTNRVSEYAFRPNTTGCAHVLRGIMRSNIIDIFVESFLVDLCLAHIYYLQGVTVLIVWVSDWSLCAKSATHMRLSRKRYIDPLAIVYFFAMHNNRGMPTSSQIGDHA